MQRRLRNVQGHVQSCCFANANILLFCCSRYRRRRLCLSWLAIAVIPKFATMVTWRYTCPFYYRMVANVIGVLHDLTYTDRVLRQRSYLLTSQVGTNVNTDCFSQVPTLKIREKKWTQAGCLCAYRGQSTALFLLLSWCFKMESGGRRGVATILTVIYRALKVWTQHHSVPVPRHLFPGTKCGEPLRMRSHLVPAH